MDNNLLLDKIHFLHSLLSSSVTPAGLVNHNLQLNLPGELVSPTKNTLAGWDILYEHIVDGEFLINLASIDAGTIVFFKELNFRQGVENVFDAGYTISKNIALIDYKNSFLVYDSRANKAYVSSSIVTNDFLVENAVHYYKTLAILKSNGFADYVNTIDKEIVLYSGTKGIKRIQIPDYLPAFDPARSMGHDCDSLVAKLGSPDFKIYFKNQLFDFRSSETATALKNIILSLENITREADNNLQLYLKNFSFENLKNDLQKEKEKYFSSLRDILGKNLSQIVAVPVSFAASVFATYKVNNDFILFIILTAFILYSVFTYYLQSLYLADVREIEDSFKKDFKFIAEKSGLSADDIDSEKIKIERRIRDIKSVVIRFRYLLITLTIIFSIFILNQVFKFA